MVLPPLWALAGLALVLHLLARLLLRRPTLLWSAAQVPPGEAPSAPWRRVRTIAHRGGQDHPRRAENSLPAFRRAYRAGVDMVELDVHLTRDGQVVVFHDGDLLRMTGRSGHVSACARGELPPLVAAPPPGLPQDEFDDSASDLGEQAIPLLAEVLAELPKSVCVLVEIKASKLGAPTGAGHAAISTEELVAKTDAILRADPRGADAEGRVVWFSLAADCCDRTLPAQNAARPRITAARTVMLATLSYWLGLLAFLPTSWIGSGARIFGMVCPASISVGLLRRVCPSFVPDGVVELLRRALKPLLVPPRMVQHLQARGLRVFLLGVNDGLSIALAAGAGVDAVLTDRPRWLVQSAGFAGSPVPPRERAAGQTKER
ncbi:unnamed protein product [Prorocentrum cordatum]|uniref:GP-PDE domain-containing protein n=1 Tax=Prorocentrum cordatum TaxID=2364126 RepID=A0ABN9XCF0_9DINO|nr:unnamed protein product [Polarella glacialis]